MQKKPLFSVIFVNYQSADILRRALRSLPEMWQLEIIVVNNDRSEEKKLEALRREIDFFLISSGENIGFGAGANLGALHARGEYIFFLNPDAFWQWGTFSEASRFFRLHPKVAVVGVKIIDFSGFPEKWSVGMPMSFFELVKNNIGLPSSRHILESKKPIGVGWVSGAAMFVRKSAFEKIGGFDERFFLYFEDADLCYRIRKECGSVVFYPDIAIHHDGGGSCSSVSLQKAEFYRSQRLYFEKHRSKDEQWSLSALRLLFGKRERR